MQVDRQPVSKPALCRNNERSLELITALLDAAVDDFEAILSSDDFFKLEVLALLQWKAPKEGHNGNSLPQKPEGGLHVGEHECLDLSLVEDEGLLLHVHVKALDDHGQAWQVLELHVLSLNHAVHAGIPRPESSWSVFLLKAQIFEESHERVLSRGPRLKI